MTNGGEAADTSGAKATSIEGALRQVASDLSDAVAALRDELRRLWASEPHDEPPSLPTA